MNVYSTWSAIKVDSSLCEPDSKEVVHVWMPSQALTAVHRDILTAKARKRDELYLITAKILGLTHKTIDNNQ